MDLASNTAKPKVGFLKDLEEHLDSSDPNFQKNFSLLKTKVLNRIKENKEKRISRRDSVSSNSSRSGSKKREPDVLQSDQSRFKEDPALKTLAQ